MGCILLENERWMGSEVPFSSDSLVLGPWCSGFYVHCFHYYLPGIWEGLGHVGICDSAEASV